MGFVAPFIEYTELEDPGRFCAGLHISKVNVSPDAT